MTGLVKFAAFSAVLIALLVVVVIPVVTGPIISGLVREAGVVGDDLEVSVDVFGPGILTGRAPSVRLQANDVEVPRAVVGRVDVRLTDVSAADRRFESISGTLWDVHITGPGGLPLVVESIELEGPADATRATGRLERSESESLVRQIADQAGVDVDHVSLGDGTVTLRQDGQDGQDGQAAEARLRVAGDTLILERADASPVVLVAAAPSESWRLQDVRVTPDGMVVDVTVDMRDLATQLTRPEP